MIRKIHLYSAFLITGSLLMYISTGFLMTRHALWKPSEEKAVTAEYPLTLPEGITDKQVPAFIRKGFGLEGHTGKVQKNGKGDMTALFSKPGIRHQVIIPADRKTIRINTVHMGTRAIITAFHRVKGYGGGFIYDLYVLMTDLTGIGLLIFSFSGIWLAFSSHKNTALKLSFLAAGIIYTLLVIFSFMRG